MFPNTRIQSAQSEVLQVESNLEEHVDAERNIKSVGDEDVNRENEIESSDAQALNPKVQASSDGILFKDDVLNRIQSRSIFSETATPNDDIPTNVFGMAGLLSGIQAAKTNPDLLALCMGLNPAELGLNLNTPELLHTTFPGPFSDLSCRLQDIDYPVPTEYLQVTKCVGQKLPELNLSRFKDDVIFLLFYGSIGDFMQLKSAAELYRRNWRYHIEEKVWLCKIPGVTSYRKIGTVEQGRFYYFSPCLWRRVPRDFEFDSSKIEQCPTLLAIIK